MSSAATLAVYLILTGLSYYYAVFRWSKRSPPLPLPPGPKRLPLIGNLLDMPRSKFAATFHAWSKVYDSDILHIDVVGLSIVVLNSYRAAAEVHEGKNFSSRPWTTMLCELFGFGNWNFILLPYGDEWRSRRKLFHKTVNENTTHQFRPHQRRSTRTLLKNLLETPDRFSRHCRHLPGGTIMSISYGMKTQDESDPYIAMAETINSAAVLAATPGQHLVDAIPVLKYVPDWVPGTGYKRDASRIRKIAQDLIDEPYAIVKAQMSDGTAKPSFVSLALNDLPENAHTAKIEVQIAEVASTMYGAATDTTTALLITVIFALVLHPHVVKKAQAEIDRVIRPGHLPDFEDESSLPYITALVMETLRWSPTVPIGVPRESIAEDTFQQYRIPAKSIVVANMWAISRNEEMYPNPDAFDPDRFLKDGVLDKDVQDPRKYQFGFGRRICPGRFLAFASVWHAVANILAAFDLSTNLDEVSSDDFDEVAVVRVPLPFKCSIVPRSEQAISLVNSVLLNHDD